MASTASEKCRSCVTTLKSIIDALDEPDHQDGRVRGAQVKNELERFSLWIGNIGALHRAESSMSLETRLREASDVLSHILGLLDDLNETASERE